MKKYTNFILNVLAICFISMNMYGQSMDSILEKTAMNFSKPERFSCKLKYTMYADDVSMQKKDETITEVIKQNNNYYMKMGSSEVVFVDGLYIKISHSEKMMSYTRINTDSIDVTSNQIPFMNFINKFDTKKVVDKGQYWLLTLETPMVTNIPYEKIKIEVDKQTYHILKQVYFFNRSMEKQYNFNASNTSHERLEIVQLSFDEAYVSEKNVFDTSHYLQAANGQLRPSNDFKNYKIIF